MKAFLHSTVRTLHLEGLIASCALVFPGLKKLIPPHTSYAEADRRRISRYHASFFIAPRDYMQWYLLAREPDNSWQIALEQLKPEHYVVDIGANVGQFCIPLAMNLRLHKARPLQILAFEPNPLVFASLVSNIQLNREAASQLIKPIQLALGDREGEMPFIYSMSNSGAGRLTDAGRETTKVKVTTLDQYLAQMGIIHRISFLKIDVEGFEPEVLAGAHEVLAKSRPVLFFEFSPAWCEERGVDAFQLISFLEKMRYTLFFEKENKIVRLDEHRVELKAVYQTNVLAIPE